MSERIEGEYMALGGDEVLEIICRKLKDTLGAYNQHFGQHLAYHNPLIRVAVKVECFTPEKMPTDGGFELAVKLTDGPCMEPDRLREEVGIGTYETKVVDEATGILANVKTNSRLVPDTQATIAKVDKLLAEREAEASKPKPRAKTKRARKRSGWPKGKKRGPRNPTPVAVAAEAS